MSDPAATPEPRSPFWPVWPIPPGQVALTGPEFMPVYHNFLRTFSDLPRVQQGGNWTYPFDRRMP